MEEENYLPIHIQKELGQHVELKNYGRPMATTREGLAISRDQPTKPDYVVINFGLVDTWVTSIPRIYISYYPSTIWRKYPLKWLKIIKKRLRYIKRFIPHGNVVPSSEYVQNIHDLIEQCRTYNKDVKITIWTTPHTQNDLARNSEIDRYNTYLKEIAIQTGCTLCESSDHIDYTNGNNYLDNVHLSPIATKKLGTAIGQTFLDS